MHDVGERVVLFVSINVYYSVSEKLLCVVCVCVLLISYYLVWVSFVLRERSYLYVLFLLKQHICYIKADPTVK